MTLFESERDFQLWRAVVGHSQLLLRSTKSETESTRIDVLFKPVRAMKLLTMLRRLRVREADAGEAIEIARETGEEKDDEGRIFIVESGPFTGFVVAGVMATHEDDGEYGDPSAILVD